MIINRRQFLSAAAYTACAGLLPRRLTAQTSSPATVEILLNEPIGTISPDLYGYLLENLGTVIYDGVWVGEGSKIPNVGGIRRTLIERLRAIKASVIRWPGGNFADYYDWKDGVGPRGSRPRRTNMWWNSMPHEAPDGPQRYDPNEFGTPEFMRLCQLSGGRPYLNANARGLTAEDFSRWVEYCNSPRRGTTLAEQREADGSPSPYGVRYWGIGNEVWAAGGDMTVEDYAALYKRFTANVPNFGFDPNFIACGGPPPTTDKHWVYEFLRICKKALAPVPIAAMSLHYYTTNPLEEEPPGTTIEQFIADHPDFRKHVTDAVAFGRSEWYDVLAKSLRMSAVIGSCWDAMAEFNHDRKIKIAVDEWGTFCRPGTQLNALDIRGRAVTLRDALASALTLDIFHQHAEKLLPANFTGLINQEGGLFRAEADHFVATPIYYVFQLYSAHQGGTALRTQFNVPSFSEAKEGKVVALQQLYGSASLNERTLTLTLVNPHVSEPCEPTVVINGGEVSSATVSTLTHTDIHAQNTFDDPERVRPVASQLDVRGSRFNCLLPAASVSRMTLNL